MRKVFAFVVVLLASSIAYADAITFNWSRVANATSYKLYQSSDLGVTWVMIGTGLVPPVSFIVPADKLLLFRVSAVNSLGETINMSSGSWYNGLFDIAPKALTTQ